MSGLWHPRSGNLLHPNLVTVGPGNHQVFALGCQPLLDPIPIDQTVANPVM